MKTKAIYKKDFKRFREKERGELLRKYYDLFASKIEIEGDLTEQDKYYIINQLYYKGTVCILHRVDGKPLVCPYAPYSWNNEDFPVNVNLINKRNIQGVFPTSMTAINLVDCVIGYIRPSHASVYSYVEHQVDKILDIVMTMKVNAFTLKLPYLFSVSPEDEAQMNALYKSLCDDEPVIFASLLEAQNTQVMQGGTYNLDKLRNEKVALENELLTQLGIDNNNNVKKEQMIVDEVNANNDEIETSANVYLTPLEAFTKEIKETLGFNISIKWSAPMGEEPRKEKKVDDDEPEE